MTTKEILEFLQNEIHTAVAATVDENNRPRTCAVDIMLADESGIYFLTAKGKDFYRRLRRSGYISFTGMKGNGTLNTIAVSFWGRVQDIGREKLDLILEKNPYMFTIYPNEKAREQLNVFCLKTAEGEYFDLSQNPVYRQSFSLGTTEKRGGYYITDLCICCDRCMEVCPTHCIEADFPRKIDVNRCLSCGACLKACPQQAIELKRD